MGFIMCGVRRQPSLNKYPRIAIFLVCFLFMLSCSAEARLGETKQESAQRYGSPLLHSSLISPPLITGIKDTEYRYQGWRIRVTFIDNIAEAIAYSKIGVSPSSKEARIRKDEKLAILKGELDGKRWQKKKRKEKVTNNPRYQVTFNSAHEMWKNSNGSIAWIPSVQTALVIVSYKARNYEQKLYRKKHPSQNTVVF